MYVRLGIAAWIGLYAGLLVLGGACSVDTEPSPNPGPEQDGGDSGADAGDDAGPDASVRDAGKDGGRDAGKDAGKDGGRDSGEDSGEDSGPPDAGEDSGPPDSGRDAAPDASDPCASAGCGDHALCAVSSGRAVCSCENGYQDNDANGTCLPVCASGSCGAHSSCADSSGAIVCSCFGGYQDNDGNGSCEAACGMHPCDAHATCSDATGVAMCSCNQGYSGDTCSDTDACALADDKDGNPCNGVDLAATCADDPAPALTYSCSCSFGYGQEDGACVLVDECAIDNGGCGHPLRASCLDTRGAPPSCTCAAQYGGPGCAYHQVYGLDLPATAQAWTEATDVPYDIDNTAAIAPFDRVAYRLQLDQTFIWVEFDKFSDDPRSLGVPADEVWDQTIGNVTVLTNASNVDEVSDQDGGNMEFWSHCYGPGPDNVYDDDDERQAIDCFGSLQLHLDGSTLLAVNHWAAATDGLGLGIGSAGGTAPDWTFGNNSAGFNVSRRLEVYVRELASCNADSCGGHGLCDDLSGVVQCECDEGYAGTHCEGCASDHQDNDSDGECEPRCAAGSCTTPGEYCFDDSGAIECAASQGASCSAILLAAAGSPDGPYVVDPDGVGGNDPLLAYCDMSHGGYTLLAVANGHSKTFGNNSPVWSASEVFGSTSIGLAGGDYKGRAYGELATSVIRLCHTNLDKCHDFAHGKNIALRSFFADGVSYDEYASNIAKHQDVGVDQSRLDYLSELAAGQAAVMCGYWLGINEPHMSSGIGLMGDINQGCGAGTGEAWIDDLAIGVGLQSCADNNSCAPGGTGHTAGRQYRWTGEQGDVGPWLILGK
jgi:hypothetical protein